MQQYSNIANIYMYYNCVFYFQFHETHSLLQNVLIDVINCIPWPYLHHPIAVVALGLLSWKDLPFSYSDIALWWAREGAGACWWPSTSVNIPTVWLISAMWGFIPWTFWTGFYIDHYHDLQMFWCLFSLLQKVHWHQ